MAIQWRGFGCGRGQISCSSQYPGDVVWSIHNDVYLSIQREILWRGSASRKEIIWDQRNAASDLSNIGETDQSRELRFFTWPRKRVLDAKSHRKMWKVSDERPRKIATCDNAQRTTLLTDTFKLDCLDLLDIAQNYGLYSLKKACIEKAKGLSLGHLRGHQMYSCGQIPFDTLQAILEGRIEMLENKAQNCGNCRQQVFPEHIQNRYSGYYW